MTDTTIQNIQRADTYLGERTGTYGQRAVRYRAAARAMKEHGLHGDMTVFDVGAGMTEFDYTLRAEFGFMGRYIPIDHGIDVTDIETWQPPRMADWFVCLEILEHIFNPYSQVKRMMNMARKGVVFSTPNPETTDVLGMDETHVIAIEPKRMERMGFTVTRETFYGGRWSNGEPDSLLGVFVKPGARVSVL